jgi:hypothetical protein
VGEAPRDNLHSKTSNRIGSPMNFKRRHELDLAKDIYYALTDEKLARPDRVSAHFLASLVGHMVERGLISEGEVEALLDKALR